METIRNEHLSEAEIEEYALGRLPRESAPAVLSHLMNCDECATLLEQEQDFRQVFCAAAEEAAKTEPSKERQTGLRWNWFPAPAMMAAAALALVIFFVPTLQRSGTTAQTLNLSAYRGGDAVTASVSSPLVLRLDTTGLETGNRADVRIVSSDGREVWRESPRKEGNQSVVTVQRRLDPGLYWVRLYRDGGETADREFRLEVK